MKIENVYIETTENYISRLYSNFTFKDAYIKDCYQNDRDCIAALQGKGWALYFVNNQSHQICLVSVQQSGYSLQYVKKQTPEICIAAVKQNSEALQFVKNQTPEICMAALKHHGFKLKKDSLILNYIRDNDLKVKIKRELNL